MSIKKSAKQKREQKIREDAQRTARRKAQQQSASAVRSRKPEKGRHAQETPVRSAISGISRWVLSKLSVFKTFVTLLCVVATAIIGYGMLKPAQQQADAAKEANDRIAGRIGAMAQIIDLVPDLDSADVKHLVRPMHPDIKATNNRGEKAGFVTFDDIRQFCKVNPRLRLKNTGEEIIESVQIHVEELSVMPIGPKGPSLLRTPGSPEPQGLVKFKPTIDPSKIESCVFIEKFKPGDVAEIPVWRPLLQAMLGAHVLTKVGDDPIGMAPGPASKTTVFMGWNGQYHGEFNVDVYVRGVGMTAADRVNKGPMPLGFIWNANGFDEKTCKEALGRPAVPLKVTSQIE